MATKLVTISYTVTARDEKAAEAYADYLRDRLRDLPEDVVDDILREDEESDDTLHREFGEVRIEVAQGDESLS